MTQSSWSRRDTLRAAIALGLAPTFAYADKKEMLTRPIPASGEALPVVGLGTWSVFDVAGSAEEIAVRREIVELLIDRGGSLIDTSPMYNRSERVIGQIIDAGTNRDHLFIATKVWTNGKTSGERQMRTSADLMRSEVIDLMQVHNLRDLDVHMETIREWQDGGRVRYNGMTHYTASALDELEAAMQQHEPQFIQINYSLGEREAEQRVLPLAKEMGIAVLINRPFVSGALFRAVGKRQLPSWASEFATSWGQFFLKFIISHPAVTSVIPATSKVHHMVDNLGAGFGTMPSDATRRRMADYMASL